MKLWVTNYKQQLITQLSSDLQFYKSINYSYIRSTETNITYNTRISYTDLLQQLMNTMTKLTQEQE